jgi:hypothetical protein
MGDLLETSKSNRTSGRSADEKAEKRPGSALPLCMTNVCTKIEKVQQVPWREV